MLAKIIGQLQDERARWVLWAPVFLGIGIGAYFSLPFEPSFRAGILLALSAIGLVLWQRSLWPVVLILFGFAAAIWRTHSIEAPVLTHPLKMTEIQGEVEEIDAKEKGTRILLKNIQLSSVPPEKTPEKLRVTIRRSVPDTLMIGDRVHLKAGIFPPPEPAIVGSFAFNRYFYYQQIGGTGFAFGDGGLKIIQKAKTNPLALRFANLRQNMTRWFQKDMGGAEGAVAAALVTGEANAIPVAVTESMRRSGVVHVLSISGMHLALVAAIFFAVIRFGFALLPGVALRVDTKKLAAILALVGTAAYLALSGSPIPAQRSFVMVALVLGAVLIDRNVTSVRSLALAAFLILLCMPESLLNASFQLSFAATLGLLAFYEHYYQRERKDTEEKYSLWRHCWRFLLGIVSTSSIATFATMPLILYHFEGFPIYSLLGNLIILPVVSLWIMPLLVAVTLLYPFAWTNALFPLLKKGIALMLWLSGQVANLPYAIIHTPPLPLWALIVMISGGLWLTLWQGKWRYLGLLAVPLSLSGLWFYQAPDMVISGDGKKLALRLNPDEVVMLRGREAGFQQNNWRRFLGVQNYTPKKQAGKETFRCDKHSCIGHYNGQIVAISYDREALPEDCAIAGIIVMPDWSGSYPYECNGKRIYDAKWLREHGATAFYLNEGGIITRTVSEWQGKRPWNAGFSAGK